MCRTSLCSTQTRLPRPVQHSLFQRQTFWFPLNSVGHHFHIKISLSDSLSEHVSHHIITASPYHTFCGARLSGFPYLRGRSEETTSEGNRLSRAMLFLLQLAHP